MGSRPIIIKRKTKMHRMIISFINWIDNVNWPQQRDSKAKKVAHLFSKHCEDVVPV